MSLPSWYKIAESELGQRELVGDKANPRIVEYHSTTSLKATSDEVPWCAAFAGWCLEKAGLPSTKSAAAISYAQYGFALATPTPGCIAVFRRQGGNHVGFFVREDPEGRIWVLGGNQGNAVTIAPQRRENLIGYRWPNTVALPSAQVKAPEPAPAKKGWLARLFGR